MRKNISQAAKEFTAWIHDLVVHNGYVFLYKKDCKCTENNLLGYYDNDGVYLFPDKVFTLAEELLEKHKKTINDIEWELCYAGFIRPESDGLKTRYRRQKRIGDTKKRYLTFERSVLFSKEEQSRYIPYHF